ncbi:hypothetical protein GCM10023346_29950 [Arthrobacter gyeryongensis]|uniref:Uncharacterized protein n=1 Tax=Arthrobacter gyeryongensis TaxID=1650592 RepID=A0ABP9SKR4_9MICC
MVGSSIEKLGPRAGRMGFRYPWVTPLSDSIRAIATIIPVMVRRATAVVAGGAVLLAMCFLECGGLLCLGVGKCEWVMRVTTLGPPSTLARNLFEIL